MTIGIFRRISDYGITINRCYILLLNIWFYGIYIYLYFTQSRHIKWILISPVAVALLTSVGFWSMANITKKSLKKEVGTVLNRQVSTKEAREIFSELTQEEKDRIESALEYLHKNYGKESIQPFFTETVSDNRWEFFSQFELEHVSYEEHENIDYYSSRDKTWQIGGYNFFTEVEYKNYSIKRNDSDDWQVTIELSADDRTFSIPLREFVMEYLSADEKLRSGKDWIIRGNDYALLIRIFEADYYPEKDSIFTNNISGYLFYK